MTQKTYETHPDEIEERLDSVRAGCADRSIFVGIRTPISTYCHSSGELFRSASGDQLLPVGCCAKLLVSVLLRRAECKGLISLRETFGKAVPNAPASLPAMVRDSSLQDLLNHTHGLPRTGLHSCPLNMRGFIDIESLASQIGSYSLIASPGGLYSYSHEGYWLCAAVLEHIHDARFATLVHAEFGIPSAAQISPDAATCAAIGGTLSLPAHTLLDVLQARGAEAQSEANTVAFPGWSPLAHGCDSGWHMYSGGWIGQNSALSSLPMLLRTHPERGISIIVASAGILPTTVAAKLFKTDIPDLVVMRSFKRPRSLDPRSLPPLASKYRNGNATAEVIDVDSSLAVEFTRSSPSGASAPVRGSLRRIDETTFCSIGELANSLPIIEFVAPPGANNIFLWNGEIALARESA